MEFAIPLVSNEGIARRVLAHEEITHLHTDLELFSFNRNSALGGRANTNYRDTNYF